MILYTAMQLDVVCIGCVYRTVRGGVGGVGLRPAPMTVP